MVGEPQDGPSSCIAQQRSHRLATEISKIPRKQICPRVAACLARGSTAKVARVGLPVRAPQSRLVGMPHMFCLSSPSANTLHIPMDTQLSAQAHVTPPKQMQATKLDERSWQWAACLFAWRGSLSLKPGGRSRCSGRTRRWPAGNHWQATCSTRGLHTSSARHATPGTKQPVCRMCFTPGLSCHYRLDCSTAYVCTREQVKVSAIS